MQKRGKNTTIGGTSVEKLILDDLADYDLTIAFDMKAGHEKDNRALILGKTIELVVRKDKSTLRFLE